MRAIVRLQFREHTGHMGFNSLLRDTQRPANPFVRLTLRDSLENLHLARREQLIRSMHRKLECDFLEDALLAPMHHPNALDKFSSHGVLEEKAPGTCFQ